MKKVHFEKIAKVEKRYSVATVSQAVWLSEGTIAGYFKNKGMSVKNGITIEQVKEVLHRGRTSSRSSGIVWEDVEEIRNNLVSDGYAIVEDE